MEKIRHLGILVIDREVLIKSLGLPADVILHNVMMEFDVNEGAALLFIEQASLPPSRTGALVPRVSAIFENTSATTPAKFKGFR